MISSLNRVRKCDRWQTDNAAAEIACTRAIHVKKDDNLVEYLTSDSVMNTANYNAYKVFLALWCHWLDDRTGFWSRKRMLQQTEQENLDQLNKLQYHI